MKYTYATHLEIPVSDMEKAKKFFGKIFGWDGNIQAFNEDYSLVFDPENSSTPSFGLYKSEEIPTNQIIVTMEVDNIESTLKIIEKQGGKITREKYQISPEIGFAANFADPFGNTWGLHSAPES